MSALYSISIVCSRQFFSKSDDKGGISMPHPFKSFILQWCDFKGRSDRTEYWTIIFTHLFITWGFVMILQFSGVHSPTSQITSILLAAYLLITWVPRMSLTIRRLHDTGMSGFWYLLTFLPFIGSLIVFGLCSREK